MNVSIDAPVGGWNAFAAIDAMEPTDAIILENMIPDAGFCRTRKGCALHVDLGHPIESLMSFRWSVAKTVPRAMGRSTPEALDRAGRERLLAAGGGAIWEIHDAQDPVELKPVGTNTSNRWQYRIIRDRLVMVNGEDPAQIYDGTSLTELDLTGTVDTLPDGNALSAADLWGVEVFKGRAFYWTKAATGFWYSKADSFQGELKYFELSNFLQRGGHLVNVATWTKDAGGGPDDFIVFLFSSGELLVYQGDDPEDLEYWEMVGRFRMAEPLSIRGTSQIGADQIILTRDGFANLATILQQGRTSDVPAFSRLIADAAQDAGRAYYDHFGWECLLYPAGGLFIVNVPVQEMTYSEQYVLNTMTGRWCKFIGWNAMCFAIYRDQLMMGSADGCVYVCDYGTSDNGRPIIVTAMPAYNYLGDPGVRKHLNAAQVLTNYSHPELIRITGYGDFKVPMLPDLIIPDEEVTGTWNISPWNEHYWERGYTANTTRGWQNVHAYGFAVTVVVRFASANESPVWRMTNYTYRKGGPF